MPDWDRIGEQQLRARRAMYDPMDVEEWDRSAQREVRKRELLDLLKNDRQFREEIKRIISSSE